MAGFRAGRVLLAALLALVAALALAPSAQAMGVMAIDYGTAFMKAALIKPGTPFDVVLGRDSKRKVASSVAWKGEERLFGADADAAASRVPHDSFPAFKALLGSPTAADPAAAFHSALHAADIRYGNGTVRVHRASSDQTFSPEEILAMQLTHMRKLAEETAGEQVRPTYPAGIPSAFGGLDVVISVPAYFSPWERDAMYDAAQLAGMRPRLVSDGLAAATSYALTRTFPTPERHVFYDSGAGGTQASVVEFRTEQVQGDSLLSIGSTPKETTTLTVLGAGWSRGAGGLALDVLVRDLLAEKFAATPAGQALSAPVTQNPRAMARLLREAVRVKHVLSANAVAMSGVESLAEDADWRGTLSREELEEAAAKKGLPAQFASPITDALSRAGLGLGEINSVVLVGGNSRVPLVQQALRDAGVASFATNVNADEANVMGAAFYGASFNPQFRMKSVSAIDAASYTVAAEREGQDPVLLATPGKALEESYLIQYADAAAQQDFVLSLSADGQAYATVNVTGISAALADVHSHLDDVTTGINLTIASRPLGTFAAGSAQLSVAPPASKGGLASALKGFFKPASSSSSSSSTAAPKATAEANDTASASGPASATPSSTAEEVAKAKTFALQVDTSYVGRYVPLAPAELKRGRDRLQTLEREQERRMQREELRNLLEGAAYRVRELADPASADEQSDFWAYSTSAERSAALKGAEDNLNFLAEEGDAADAAVLRLRLTEMEKAVSGVERRADEALRRPDAVAGLRALLEQARAFVSEARANLTQALAEGTASKYSAAELDTLSAAVGKEEKWLTEGAQVQEKRNPKQDPVFWVADVQKRHTRLAEQIKKLRKRRIPKTRPAKKQSPSASASSTSSASASSTSSATPSTSPSASASSTSSAEKATVSPHEDL